jgi:acyl carrier protein
MNNHSISEQHLRLTPPVTSAQVRAFLVQLDALIDADKLQETTRFGDAGADSLDFYNIITEIQIATGILIDDKDIEQVNTLAGLTSYINAKMA